MYLELFQRCSLIMYGCEIEKKFSEIKVSLCDVKNMQGIEFLAAVHSRVQVPLWGRLHLQNCEMYFLVQTVFSHVTAK